MESGIPPFQEVCHTLMNAARGLSVKALEGFHKSQGTSQEFGEVRVNPIRKNVWMVAVSPLKEYPKIGFEVRAIEWNPGKRRCRCATARWITTARTHTNTIRHSECKN